MSRGTAQNNSHYLTCMKSLFLYLIICLVLFYSELEGLAYFVAALCHDIDHRGTSNSFQVASVSIGGEYGRSRGVFNRSLILTSGVLKP